MSYRIPCTSIPLVNLGCRFQDMKVKGNPIRLGVPANEANMEEQFQHALIIDPSLEQGCFTAKDLKKAMHFT